MGGGDGNDILNGGLGDDVLIGGAGIDQLNGGEGSDLYLVNSVSDYSSAEIARTPAPPVSTSCASLRRTGLRRSSWRLPNSGIERIVIGTGTGTTAVTTGLIANSVDARALLTEVEIFGNYGDNTIYGGTGDDYLDGGLGMTSFTAVPAITFEIYGSGVAHEEAGEGIDTLISWSGGTLADIYINIENLTLAGTANMDGTGNDGINVIKGNDGQNTLHGLAATTTSTVTVVMTKSTVIPGTTFSKAAPEMILIGTLT